MKKTLLIGLFAVPAISFGQTTIASDNFDSYTAGGTVAAQSSGLWETWSGTTPEDAFVSDSVSQSGANSMFVQQTGAGAYLHDMVMAFPSVYTTGRYEWKMSYFVPTGKGAYFNLGSVWNSGGAGYEYGLDVFFNGDGSGFTNSSGAGVFTYTQDEWTAISVMVDLDAGTYDLMINGSSVSTGAWAAASGFGVVDVFGLGYTDGSGSADGLGYFFVDDVELINWTGVGLSESTINPTLNVVPNPSNGNFSINYTDMDMANATVSVIDVLGNVVYSADQAVVGNGSMSFDLNLNNGVYFVTVNQGTDKLMKRVVVRK